MIDISFTDLKHTNHSCNTIPYGIGMVAAYAIKKFGDKISISLFKDTSDFIKYLENKIPKVACFSNYLWNLNLSCQFAKIIKKKSPDTVIVFGGPNYPIKPDKQETFLLNHPEIDFYVVRDGELAFVNLLDRLFEYNFNIDKLKNDERVIGGCHYISNQHAVFGEPITTSELDTLPSPYLTGLCDNLLCKDFIPLVQTTRGCPFSCTFCQQGNSSFNQIVRFSPERVGDEVEYIACRTSVPNLMLADANFGMYKEDIEVAKLISSIQGKHNYPKYFQGIEGKNKKDRIIETASLINGAYLSAAVQSTNKDVLDNVKRKSVSIEQMIQVAKYSELLGRNSFSEIILCLPGDTKEAHFKSILDLIDAGISVVRSHQLVMLPGSEINSDESRQKYGMQTAFRVSPNTTSRYYLFGEEFEAPEIDEICVSNNTMTFNDYLDCRLFNLTVEIFYNDSIVSELIKYLRLNEISTSLFITEVHSYITTLENSLTGLYNDFLRETNEIWRSREELEAFLKQPGIIDKHISGELGNNEQLVYRAIAILKRTGDLHSIAFSVARKLMNDRGVLSRKDELYMNELFRFSLLRKGSILSMDVVVRDKFHYDFVGLESVNFNRHPFNYYNRDGVTIEFAYTNTQKELFSQYVKLYGLTNYGLGNIISNATQLSTLYSKTRIVDKCTNL